MLWEIKLAHEFAILENWSAVKQPCLMKEKQMWNVSKCPFL